MDNDNLDQTQVAPQSQIVSPAPTITAPSAATPVPAKKLPILTIALAIIAAAAVGFAVFEAFQIADLKQKAEQQASTRVFNNYRIETIDEKDYYIITGDYSGEYDLQIVDMDEKDTRTDFRSRMTHEGFNKEEIMTLDEYSDFCKTWKLEQKYTDAEKSYAVLSYAALNVPKLEVRLADVEIDDSAVKFYVWDGERSDYGSGMGYLLVVPIESSAKTLEVTRLITQAEFDRPSWWQP